MTDTSTHIEFESIYELLNNLNNSANDFESNMPLTTNTSSNGFDLMRDAGFSIDSFMNYNQNVQELANALREFYRINQKYLENMESSDTYIDSNIPEYIPVELQDKKVFNFNVDSIVEEISKSNMSDLSIEAQRLNGNERMLDQKQFEDKYATIARQDMQDIVKNEAEKSELNEKEFTGQKAELYEMKTDGAKGIGMLDIDSSRFSRNNLNNINRNQNSEMVAFDDSGFASNKFESKNFNKIDNSKNVGPQKFNLGNNRFGGLNSAILGSSSQPTSSNTSTNNNDKANLFNSNNDILPKKEDILNKVQTETKQTHGTSKLGMNNSKIQAILADKDRINYIK